MPATNFSEEQAAQIVAYLRSLAATRRSGSAAGDPIRGKAIFDGKGGCTRVPPRRPAGSRVAPDLSDIGSARGAVEPAALDPGSEQAR